MKQKQWDAWIAMGELPKGMTYWIPDLYEENLVRDLAWDGYAIDHRLLGRGILFRTKAQAVACAKRMLAAAKDGK